MVARPPRFGSVLVTFGIRHELFWWVGATFTPSAKPRAPFGS